VRVIESTRLLTALQRRRKFWDRKLQTTIDCELAEMLSPCSHPF
jgi:hypothetical protein